MLTSSMSSIIGSDGQGVNLLHFCNGLNNVCQDPTLNTSPLFASCRSNCADACCAQEMESSRNSSGEVKHRNPQAIMFCLPARLTQWAINSSSPRCASPHSYGAPDLPISYLWTEIIIFLNTHSGVCGWHVPMRLKKEPHTFTSKFVIRVFVVDENLLNNIAAEKTEGYAIALVPHFLLKTIS